MHARARIQPRAYKTRLRAQDTLKAQHRAEADSQSAAAAGALVPAQSQASLGCHSAHEAAALGAVFDSDLSKANALLSHRSVRDYTLHLLWTS